MVVHIDRVTWYLLTLPILILRIVQRDIPDEFSVPGKVLGAVIDKVGPLAVVLDNGSLN